MAQFKIFPKFCEKGNFEKQHLDSGGEGQVCTLRLFLDQESTHSNSSPIWKRGVMSPKQRWMNDCLWYC